MGSTAMDDTCRVERYKTKGGKDAYFISAAALCNHGLLEFQVTPRANGGLTIRVDPICVLAGGQSIPIEQSIPIDDLMGVLAEAAKGYLLSKLIDCAAFGITEPEARPAP
jgi:hypothetical protein